MNIYEPNTELELQVLRGLLERKEFIRRFAEMQVKPEVFGSEDAPFIRQVVEQITTYFVRYNDRMRVAQIRDEVDREVAERDEKEARLVKAKVKRVLTEALRTPMRPAELPYLLDSLIELHRSYTIIEQAKELERFYGCKFEHGKHDACKGCPVWVNCKHLQDSEKTFSEKVFYIQDTLRDRLLQASGDSTVTKSKASDGMSRARDRYLERKRIREEAGEDFTFGIKTPWPTITKATDGWKPGKLYGIWAPKKTGKTTALIMAAAECIRDGHDCVVFAMEDNDEEWLDKFYCQQACVEWEDFEKGTLSEHEEANLLKVQEHYAEAWAEGTIGEIHQYHRPINKIGLDDMRMFLESLRTAGVKIGAFTLDHMMITRRPWRRDLTRDDQRLNAIGEGSKALAQDFHCAGIVAHQLKTSGQRAGHARGSDQLEDCFDAVWYLEFVKGVMKMYTSVARSFAPHKFELDDHRNRLLLPESEDETASIAEEAIDIPDEGWLG
jgi:hypothetical protein